MLIGGLELTKMLKLVVTNYIYIMSNVDNIYINVHIDY
jgi:hypothetical protein